MAEEKDRTWAWRPSLVLILCFNSALVAWLLIEPGGPALTTAVDDVGQFLGPLIALPLCWGPWRRWRHGSRGDAAQRWAPRLLGLGILSFAVGQIMYTCYEQVLHYML